jgi:PAS domain S-box-containing protein
MMSIMDGRAALIAAGLAAVTFVAAAVLRRSARDQAAWPGARYLAMALLLLALGEAAILVAEIRGATPLGPGALDVLFLLPLIPFARAARDAYRAHLPRRELAEVEADVVLIMVSLAAILYLVIRPIGADPAVSGSAMVFAIDAAVLTSLFSGLALRAPSRPHVLLFLVLAGMAVGFAALGWEWTRESFDGFSSLVVVPLAACPLLLAAIVTFTRSPEARAPAESAGRFARPILVILSVVGACVALAVVATADEARGIEGQQSTVIIAVLCAAIVARIIANQVANTSAHGEVSRALDEKAAALHATDVALGRVREAAQTLRSSEEHLHLVFDTAVDGIVELSLDGRILRANEAFCQLVGLGPDVVEGQAWSAVAATVDGPDASFAGLPETGQAEIRGREGQAIHLESRVSEVPTSPPRRLLLVRDVSAAKVAEQTIRSLFQFLQDRDEDRTRLLRRTNAAIEGERNRIARDLHDGPVQGVSAASLSLEAALLMFRAGEEEGGLDVLSKIREELADEADALRRLMSGLRPPVLEERGLLPAIRDTIGRFDDEQGLRAQLEGTIEHPLPHELETLAYRVVQEALTNAAKHAEAKEVVVRVRSDPTQVQVEVADDGVGFDPTRARDFLRAGRVGLASMRERVELAGGTFTVRSSADHGTTVLASLPVVPSIVGEPASREP